MLPMNICLLVTCAVGAYCVQLDWQQRNFNVINSIYNTTIYPHNTVFLSKGANAIPQGLFSPNVTGRVTPIGNFSGHEEVWEYFFGLTPPARAPLFDTWTKAEIVSFQSGCPEVASSVVYGATTGINPNASTFGKTVTTIKQVRLYISAELTKLTDWRLGCLLALRRERGSEIFRCMASKLAAVHQQTLRNHSEHKHSCGECWRDRNTL